MDAETARKQAVESMDTHLQQLVAMVFNEIKDLGARTKFYEQIEKILDDFEVIRQ